MRGGGVCVCKGTVSFFYVRMFVWNIMTHSRQCFVKWNIWISAKMCEVLSEAEGKLNMACYKYQVLMFKEMLIMYFPTYDIRWLIVFCKGTEDLLVCIKMLDVILDSIHKFNIQIEWHNECARKCYALLTYSSVMLLFAVMHCFLPFCTVFSKKIMEWQKTYCRFKWPLLASSKPFTCSYMGLRG
jgi:hypothetical protein